MSRKQTGLFGSRAVCIQARSSERVRQSSSSDWTVSRCGRARRPLAVRSEPHSNLPSYISVLLRDMILLERDSTRQGEFVSF